MQTNPTIASPELAALQKENEELKLKLANKSVEDAEVRKGMNAGLTRPQAEKVLRNRAAFTARVAQFTTGHHAGRASQLAAKQLERDTMHQGQR